MVTEVISTAREAGPDCHSGPCDFRFGNSLVVNAGARFSMMSDNAGARFSMVSNKDVTVKRAIAAISDDA